MPLKTQSMPAAVLKFFTVFLAIVFVGTGLTSAWALESSTFEAPSGQSRVAPNGEWIVVAGESPRSLAQLLYPQQPAVQRRFIAALAEANPVADIDASGMQTLPVGMLLRMPDWRLLGGRAEVARSERRGGLLDSSMETVVTREPQPTKRASKAVHAPESVGTAALPRLRLSMDLAAAGEASDQLRQILRLEYRLLITLNEQLSALSTALPAPQQLAPAAAPPALPQPPEPPPSPVPLQQAPSLSTPPAPQPPVTSPPATVKIKEVPAPPPAPVVDTSSDESVWIYYLGVAAAALLLVWLVLRRRRVVAGEQQDFEMAQTVLLEHPVPVNSVVIPVSSSKSAEPLPASKAPAMPPVPVEPEMADANPVMELAEIMLSFGRIQGAAQTLQEYIEANPKEALQPWVKLLDIYRTGDMHTEFDELAQKLNKNFNVEVQHWERPAAPVVETEEQLPKATTLEELPHICTQVIARWGLPDCLDYLHQLLRDNRGGQRSGFTLPVVQEILLLIDILVDREAA
ncbi:MAG: hypothetical protein QG672_165 [Pseudomonadota bacterium]|nr:hypothetical protein [Pseudomonadota bacterium]MDQ5946378.1 hypothetical protein [Pseudomonadota bacterium]